ncbi:MAG: metal-dependent phosphohydrolase [Anaerolineaceae bacterium]|nr:MAG: metal-dependent phosphohydrolase [Anaerolineaceae bacterium]
MLNWQDLMTDMFVQHLQDGYRRMYGDIDSDFGRIVAWCGRLSLENISNSDALYHDINHTVMVSLAGLSIIEGKHLREGGVTPRDWMHYMIAVLCHDIGYVKGVCRADTGDMFATGVVGELIRIPPEGTDVSLTPHHVNRSKLFVRERFGTTLLDGMTDHLDAELIASYIEITRFPSPEGEMYQDTKGLGGLVRAADFIGQLGDPDYFRKSPALYYEFQELGLNEKFGYKCPNDLRKKYASFYWERVNPYIKDALVYLGMTQSGKQWIANMHSHVFESEHGQQQA